MEDQHYHHNNPINNTIIPSSPHVVIFPLPIQGPINCMLKFAELLLTLSEATISITFVTTDFIHRCLALYSSTAARLIHSGPHFRFETVPDVVAPDEDPRGSRHVVDVTVWLEDQAKAEGSRLRELLAYRSAEPNAKKPVTCVIADGMFGCMADVAEELKVPLVYFETISPSALWTYLCLPNMVQAGDLPFQGEGDLDAAITSVPGMETYLRRRDLPSFCRGFDPNDPAVKLKLNESMNWSRAQGHILNSFDKLEGDYFGHIQALCPNLYNIGPLHLSLKCRIQHITTDTFSNSLWKEDCSCLAWLDAQPTRSVLFVSIGSIAVMTWDQLMEFWYGLVNSMTRFLWVRRPYSIIGLTDEEAKGRHVGVMDEVLLEGTKERGRIVSWAPQEEVLAHIAVGGFLTHSGWNSTLESIVEGVPMICWPYNVDQQVNSRLVSEMWKIGLDMKDTNCNRVVIEKMIKDLMDTKREQLLARINEMAKLAREAVAEDGSSYNSLNRLVSDIKYMRFHTPCNR